MSILAAEGLSFCYGSNRVLRDLSIPVSRGKLTGIIGPNGCGKSTLLHLLAGLLEPSDGRVLLEGVPLNCLRRRERAKTVGFLPQNPLCPDLMTAGQLLEHGRYPYRRLFSTLSSPDRRAITACKNRLGLSELINQPMGSLSGGQRQKVWLAMTLVRESPVILLDEPISSLDLGHQMEVLEIISEFCKAGTTAVLVIHDLTLAAAYCDELLALNQGICVAKGKPSDILTPLLIKNLFGASVSVTFSDKNNAPVIIPNKSECH